MSRPSIPEATQLDWIFLRCDIVELTTDPIKDDLLYFKVVQIHTANDCEKGHL